MKQTKMMKKNYEFKNVLSKGNYYSGRCIEVKRNHIKRLVRESYQRQEQNIKEGNQIVFLWKKKVDIKNATFSNVENDIKTIFDKAKIIKEKA